jgi:HlyD family secretion protein
MANRTNSNAVSTMRARHRLAPLMLALLSLGWSGCEHYEEPPPVGVPTVATIRPLRQNLQRMILQPGFLQPYEQTPIYSRVPGYLEIVNVDIGDHLKKGDLLAKVWVPELVQDLNAKTARAEQAEAQIKQARANLDAAKANVDTAKAHLVEADAGIPRAEAEYKRWVAEVERSKKLLSSAVYDQQNLDVVTYQMQVADAVRTQAKAKQMSAKAALVESQAKQVKAAADVEAAEASLGVMKADRDQAQVWLDYRNLTAPYDGVVTLRAVHTGAFVTAASSGSTNKAAEPLFTMMRTDKMRVVIQVPEYDAPLVHYGSDAVIRFQALNDKEIRGKVTRTADTLDPQARTLRVEVHLPNPDEKLVPAMYVNAAISADVPDALTLPVEAIYTDGEMTYCFILQNGKAIRTAIKVGVSNDRIVEVLKKQVRSPQDHAQNQWIDFTGNEAIVANNPESLIDGQAVTVKD